MENEKIGLRIYFSIDGSPFMYDKNNENQYSSDIEVIFQIIDVDIQKEISRDFLELNILKNTFVETKVDNYYYGDVNFELPNKSYALNIKVIDSKTKKTWNKQLDIDSSNYSNYLSNLYLYYVDKGRNQTIKKSINRDVKHINCRFQYFNKDANVKDLTLYLINKKDTVINKQIPVLNHSNQYEVELELDSKVGGASKISITDGIESRYRKFYIEDYSNIDFWSNDTKIIKAVMRYILPYKEYKKIKSMSDEDSIIFFKKYWAKIDPNKDTDENEFLMELNNRIKKVTSRFKEMSTEGWSTDRGRIYIINGEPNSIRTEHNPSSNNVRQIWVYQSGDIYVFEENSFGRFYLINGGI